MEKHIFVWFIDKIHWHNEYVALLLQLYKLERMRHFYLNKRDYYYSIGFFLIILLKILHVIL